MLESRAISSASATLPRSRMVRSSSQAWSKWSSMAPLWRPFTMMTSVMPAATASSITSWIVGLSTMGNISLGTARVAGRKRVPRPAAGITALRTRCAVIAADHNTGYRRARG